MDEDKLLEAASMDDIGAELEREEKIGLHVDDLKEPVEVVIPKEIVEELKKAILPMHDIPPVPTEVRSERATAAPDANHRTDGRLKHPNKGKKRLSGLVDQDLFKIVTKRMVKGDKDQSDAFKRILEEFAEYEAEGKFTFDDAADMLLKTIDPSLVSWMKEIALSRRIPVWQIIMGLVKLASERSEIPCFITEPTWSEPEIFTRDSFCPTCKVNFKPIRLGQLFCSNACSATPSIQEPTSTRHISI